MLVMPLFVSDEEFRRCSHNAVLLSADKYIRGLNYQFKEVKAVLVEQRNSQIDMRSANAEEYIYKIVDLTTKAASKDTRIWLLESELGRLRAANDRFVQELSTKDAAAAAEERSVAEISTREWAEVKRELQEQRDLVMQLSFEQMLAKFWDEIEKLREEVQSSKLQVDEVKRSLEDEIRSLRERVNELYSECKLKTEEVISATAGKEEALAGVLSEIASVKDDYSGKEEPLLDEQIQVELRDTVEEASTSTTVDVGSWIKVDPLPHKIVGGNQCRH